MEAGTAASGAVEFWVERSGAFELNSWEPEPEFLEKNLESRSLSILKSVAGARAFGGKRFGAGGLPILKSGAEVGAFGGKRFGAGAFELPSLEPEPFRKISYEKNFLKEIQTCFV